jgi:hypothetical protein
VYEINRRSEMAEGQMVLSVTFEDPKEGSIEQLENLCGAGCETHDPHSGRAKKIHHITGELR